MFFKIILTPSAVSSTGLFMPPAVQGSWRAMSGGPRSFFCMNTRTCHETFMASRFESPMAVPWEFATAVLNTPIDPSAIKPNHDPVALTLSP